MNRFQFASKVYCLGDSHAGIWELYQQMGLLTEQAQILDWFHWMENLHTVGHSNSCSKLKPCCGQGRLIRPSRADASYGYSQAEEIPVDLVRVACEAHFSHQHVSKVLAYRCTYLNRQRDSMFLSKR